MGQFRHHRPGATGAGRRIYDLLRAQIADGTLHTGAAHEQLAAEGFLVTSTGRVAPGSPALWRRLQCLARVQADTPSLRQPCPSLGVAWREGMPALPHAELPP